MFDPCGVEGLGSRARRPQVSPTPNDVPPYGEGEMVFLEAAFRRAEGFRGASRPLVSGAPSGSCDESGGRFLSARLYTWYAASYMSQRRADERKKKWEIDQCRAVAEQINNLRGTDYEPKPVDCRQEFPDARLMSASGKYPAIEVEVTSIPLDFLERDDNDNDRKIRETLARFLLSKGVEHYQVDVGLAVEARVHGVSKALLEQLAELLFEVASDEDNSTSTRVNFSRIYRHSPELAKYVTDVWLFHHKSIRGVQVDVAEGQCLPSDGRWIEEGIRKKLEKYRDRKMLENIMLVVGVAAFVDDEQMIAFRASNAEEMLPFSEIWIVTYYDRGVFCLKSRTAEPPVR